jgi:hypothetical protein
MYGFLLNPQHGNVSEINPYSGFKHHGMARDALKAASSLTPIFFFSIKKRVTAKSGRLSKMPNKK